MKTIIYLLTFLFLIASVFGATVRRDMPSRIEPGKELTVTFRITDATIGKVFTLEDKIPTEFKIKEWSVIGAQETKDKISTRFQGNRYGWSFTPATSTVKIIYKIDIPSTASGDYNFDAVWFDPTGQSRNTKTLTVKPVVCGDGVCESGENYNNCPSDCPKPVTQPKPEAPKEASKPVQKPPIKEEKEGTPIILLTVVIIIVLIIYFIFRKKKK